MPHFVFKTIDIILKPKARPLTSIRRCGKTCYNHGGSYDKFPVALKTYHTPCIFILLATNVTIISDLCIYFDVCWQSNSEIWLSTTKYLGPSRVPLQEKGSSFCEKNLLQLNRFRLWMGKYSDGIIYVLTTVSPEWSFIACNCNYFTFKTKGSCLGYMYSICILHKSKFQYCVY